MNFRKLIMITLVTFFIATFPSWFISSNIDYLVKPFAISKIIFPIVWTILYLLMAIAFYLVVDSKKTWLIYFAQLIVNSLWTVIFFGLRWRLLAFIWLIILICLVGIMIYKFYQENKAAGYILLPYMAWLIFAGYLNLTLYLLNR